MDGHDPADEDQWWYPDGYPDEDATIHSPRDARDNFIDMFGNSTYVRWDLSRDVHVILLIYL